MKLTSAASVRSVKTAKFGCVMSLQEYTADILATASLAKKYRLCMIPSPR